MMMPVAGSAPHTGARFGSTTQIGAETPGRRKREEGENLAKGRARDAAVRCEDCFFRRHGLCALGLDSPCPTFRPDTPDGLVPPRQPALLMRHRREPSRTPAISQAA
jgi:hypothetical protein